MNTVITEKKRGRFVLIAGAAILVYLAATSLIRNGSGAEGRGTPYKYAAERRQFTPLKGVSIGDNSPWRLASLRGKVVLLNYAATWCPPCLRETPDLVAVADQYRSAGFEIVGLMMDEGSRESISGQVQQYARRYEISYPLVQPEPDPLLAFSGLGLPTSILLDRQGRLVRTYIGPVSAARLSADIERLLREAGSVIPLPKS